MLMEIILLYAATYTIVDEKTGEVKKGVTCNYYFNTNLDAVDNSNGSVGTRPAKGSMDYDVFAKIYKAPALYDAEFEMNIGSDMKPVLKIKNLRYKSQIVMQPMPEDKNSKAAG